MRKEKSGSHTKITWIIDSEIRNLITAAPESLTFPVLVIAKSGTMDMAVEVLPLCIISAFLLLLVLTVCAHKLGVFLESFHVTQDCALFFFLFLNLIFPLVYNF